MRTQTRTLAATVGLGLAAWTFLGVGRRLGYGATDEESRGALPGDGLIPAPDLSATRAITVHRPADAVWPWIAQLGQGRGGFYSYDVLENLAGCNIVSANRIVADWQQVKIGDDVRLTPEVALKVAQVEPGRTLVLRGGVPMGKTLPPYDFSWTFALRDEPDGSTRVLVRERYVYKRWWAPPIVAVAVLMSRVMSRKMLRGIRERAEQVGDPACARAKWPTPFNEEVDRVRKTHILQHR
jgi:hypothetical protein